VDVELVELQTEIVRAYRKPDSFWQFLRARLAVDIDYIPEAEYESRVMKVLDRLDDEGRTRELLRKASLVKTNERGLQLLARRVLSRNEPLIDILERSRIPWEKLLDQFSQVADINTLSLGAQAPLPAEPGQEYLYALRCEALVDALTDAPERSDRTFRFPILQFTAGLAASYPDVAPELRQWLHVAARSYGEKIPELLIIHLSDDRETAGNIISALKARDVRAAAEEWSSLKPAAWELLQARSGGAISRIAVLLGRNTAAQWCAAAALKAPSELGQTAVFPILVGVPRTAVQISFLLPNTWVVLDLGDDRTVDTLVTRIRSDTPQAERRNTTQLLDDAAPRLAKLLPAGDLVFMLGPAVSRPPSGYALALALLRRLGIELQDGALVLPMDLAGSYFALKNTDKELLTVIREQLHAVSGIPPTHLALSALLAELPAHRVTKRQEGAVKDPPRPLIVTTNLDLMMERALILQGISFTRIVQHAPGNTPAVLTSDFRVQRTEQRRPDSKDGTRTYDVTVDGVGEPIRAIVDEDGRFTLDGDGWALLEMAVQTAGVVPAMPARPGAEVSYNVPVLYKFHGSLDVDRSSAVTSDHYDFFDFSAAPTWIIERVKNDPLLLLGYCYTDPQLRQLRRTLLRNLANTNVDRYAVQYPLPPEEPLYHVERALSRRLINLWKTVFMDAIEYDGATVLSEILNELRALTPAPSLQ
jgi:hypothetical protein